MSRRKLPKFSSASYNFNNALTITYHNSSSSRLLVDLISTNHPAVLPGLPTKSSPTNSIRTLSRKSSHSRVCAFQDICNTHCLGRSWTCPIKRIIIQIKQDQLAWRCWRGGGFRWIYAVDCQMWHPWRWWHASDIWQLEVRVTIGQSNGYDYQSVVSEIHSYFHAHKVGIKAISHLRWIDPRFRTIVLHRLPHTIKEQRTHVEENAVHA